MKINTTFQLMDEIAKIIVGPRPKVIGNQTRASRDHLKIFLEMTPLNRKFKRIKEDPVNFVQVPIEVSGSYPIKAISILTGFEPIIDEERLEDYDHHKETAILLHPYTSADTTQAIFLANHFLRTSFELCNLLDINEDTLSDEQGHYVDRIGKAEYLLSSSAWSLKYLFSYLLDNTKELGLFQNVENLKYFDEETFNYSPMFAKDSELVNKYVFDAIVNVVMRKIYNLIVTSTDKSIIVDKKIAFDKLFNTIYVQNFKDPDSYCISSGFHLYESYSIIVSSLIDQFMDASPDYNIDMWLHMICMAYEEYENLILTV